MNWSAIAEIAGPALAALVGSWVGAEVALRRFKRERAFKYRLDWYRQTLRAVNRVHRSFRLAALATQQGHHGEAGTELRQANDALIEAFKLTREASLFATESTVNALQNARKRVGEIEAPDQTSTKQNIIDRSSQVAEVFEDVADTLAKDGREHLGSDPLEING